MNPNVGVLINSMTVSPFGRFRYNKTEDLPPGGQEMNSFTHLLLGVSGNELREYDPYRETHTLLTTVRGYSGIRLKWPPGVVTEPRILLLKNRNIHV